MKLLVGQSDSVFIRCERNQVSLMLLVRSSEVVNKQQHNSLEREKTHQQGAPVAHQSLLTTSL